MLTVVLAVAVVGIALLAAAVVTDNTWIALAAIALAVVGLFVLARDWLADRRHAESAATTPAQLDDLSEPEHVSENEPLEPDEFEPDMPYEELDASQDSVDDEHGSVTTQKGGGLLRSAT